MKSARGRFVVADNVDGTRVGLLDNGRRSMYVWVGRPDDDDDSERVAELTYSQIRHLIAEMQARLPKPPRRRSPVKRGKKK